MSKKNVLNYRKKWLGKCPKQTQYLDAKLNEKFIPLFLKKGFYFVNKTSDQYISNLNPNELCLEKEKDDFIYRILITFTRYLSPSISIYLSKYCVKNSLIIYFSGADVVKNNNDTWFGQPRLIPFIFWINRCTDILVNRLCGYEKQIYDFFKKT